MDLLDRLPGHDAWTTRQLLGRCRDLSDEPHVITHSMHHRAQLLFMLRRLGVKDLPEGDVLTWEQQTGPADPREVAGTNENH